MSAPPVTTLAELADRHSVFFVDQFGVLHDGERPYPGAIEALRFLRERRRKVVLISNSGRSGGYNAERLRRLGFAGDLYDLFVTSGDVALDLLRSGVIGVAPGPATRCLSIASPGDRFLVKAMGFSDATGAQDADLLLVAGNPGDRPLDDYRPLFSALAVRNVPALCTNPDRIMLTPSGTSFGPGAIAEAYAALGRHVLFVGKPHAAIYQFAMKAIAAKPPAIVAIGDSIEHDVAGARSIGAAAALVRTGILAAADEDALAEEMRRRGATPDYLLPAFRP